MACESFFTCDNKDLTFEQVFRRMIVADENGCPALRTVEVEISEGESCLSFIDCENNSLGMEQLLKSLIVADENGCPAIKIAVKNV